MKTKVLTMILASVLSVAFMSCGADARVAVFPFYTGHGVSGDVALRARGIALERLVTTSGVVAINLDAIDEEIAQAGAATLQVVFARLCKHS